MKTYKRSRTYNEFTTVALQKGFVIYPKPYAIGSDWVHFRGDIYGKRILAHFNVVSGRIEGFANGVRFSTDDKLDGKSWFDAILDLACTNEPLNSRIQP